MMNVNVAPSSTTGHYVKGANVVNLDEVNETFLVEKESIMETENHLTIPIDEMGLITCQVVVNPITKMYEKSKD